MADIDPIALAVAMAEAEQEFKKPSVLSKMWTAVSGEGSDPTIPSAIDANLGLSASKSAQMTALFATTRSPERLKSGMLKVEPTAEFTEDDTGRLVALWPIRRNGELTGQVTRFYPNEPGLGFTEPWAPRGQYTKY